MWSPGRLCVDRFYTWPPPRIHAAFLLFPVFRWSVLPSAQLPEPESCHAGVFFLLQHPVRGWVTQSGSSVPWVCPSPFLLHHHLLPELPEFEILETGLLGPSLVPLPALPISDPHVSKAKSSKTYIFPKQSGLNPGEWLLREFRMNYKALWNPAST